MFICYEVERNFSFIPMYVLIEIFINIIKLSLVYFIYLHLNYKQSFLELKLISIILF